MFKRILHLPKWIRAVRARDSGRDADFLAIVSELKPSVVSSPYQQSLIATSMLIVGRYAEAEFIFNSVANKLEFSTSSNNQYIKLYCEARIAGMRGDLALVDCIADKAQKIICKSLYREALPIK